MLKQILLWVLCTMTSVLAAQITNSVVYDFRDGTIISAGQSADEKLKLSGNYSFHSANYGLNMKVNGEISIDVEGSSTIRFLGSQYSGLKMEGSGAATGDLGTLNTKVQNDLSDAFDFTYSGKAGKLTFKLVAGTGNDLYLPKIEVIPSQSGIAVDAPEKNIVYFFDLRDGSIIPTNTTGTTDLHLGLFDLTVGPSNAYGYNGTQHGSVLKTGNKIILKVNGNAKIRFGGSIYSNGTIAANSSSGAFDVASKESKTSGNFGNDGSTADFTYVGPAGDLTFSFTGTNYIPYIEIVPITYDITLTQWVQKSGTIVINNVTIGLTAGADASGNAVVTLSEGTVISATPTAASVLINLGGKSLSEYTPVLSGDIESVSLTGDSILVHYADAANADPTDYLIRATDNSIKVMAEYGKTYMYNFANGSELPQTSYQALRYTTYVSKDGILTINSNTDVTARQFGYHDAAHGGVFFPGNSFSMSVAGDAIVTFFVDTYGVAADATFEYSDSQGNILGSTAAVNLGGTDGLPVNFAYTGDGGIITATIKSAAFPTAEIYLHGMSVENAPKKEPLSGKVDVWDFGAEQLDTNIYNNVLNEDVINAWYPETVTKGTSGNVLPAAFTSGILSWTGGSNDRLRTTNTNLTRFDQNIASVTPYTGRIYVNSGANTTRFLSLALEEDDEITLVTKTDAGGAINFQFVADPDAQTDVVPITSDLIVLNFVAQQAGSYRIFDTQGKPSYYRLERKNAQYIEVTGTLDKTQAPNIPSDFQLVFTNQKGKSWTASGAGDNYNITLPGGYQYDLSLMNANGFIIGSDLSVYVSDSSKVHDLILQRVAVFNVTGQITGLGEKIGNASLVYTPDPESNAIFMPAPVIDVENSTYAVELEPNVTYTISAEGVNDFVVSNNTVNIQAADTLVDIAFEAKPVHAITINASGLDTDKLASAQLVFENMNESGYVYSFSGVNEIALRDGTYKISLSGLDQFPIELGLTSNLTVSGGPTSKDLQFKPVHFWGFDDKTIVNGDPAYKGLLFSGNIYNEKAKSHLSAASGSSLQVPVSPGERIIVKYYYTADFSFNGEQQTTTNSQSTGTIETTTYEYKGDTIGHVTILFGAGSSTTYITDIITNTIVEYKETLTVGVDKEYQIINDALDAVRRMKRESGQRVTILIDPGNYEEMLVIDEAFVTLKNASATPSIALKNKGVDIDDHAVRVTSYYGYGYNYFSMNNQLWNADVLKVNKENGYHSYENKSGTTNGSYWNATVVIYATDFVAEDIIFENSYNQYISRKEAQDVVVQWESGSKGERPKEIGNVEVQDRKFVERACALAIANNAQRAILYRSRIIGRQDALFGGTNARFVMYKGVAMGAVDYIFGGMSAVFYKTDLSMNTSDVSSDATYITAAQQRGTRGYLMYECNVVSAQPGTESASANSSKPGFFGRPWEATTSEVVFYKTNIAASQFPGSEGKSLISPVGWTNSLGGESNKMYEFGTVELSGENNTSQRASWSTILTTPVLSDGTEITTFNFTKGDDNWDPIPDLIAKEGTVSTKADRLESPVDIWSHENQIMIQNVGVPTQVRIYDVQGVLHHSVLIRGDVQISAPKTGLWIVHCSSAQGNKARKVLTY